MYIYNRTQRGLRSQKAVTRSHLTGVVVWTLEHKEEDKSQAIYFSHRRRSVEAYFTVEGRDIPFVNNAKNLGVIFDKKKNTCRLHIETIVANDLRTFISIYPLLKSERLSVNVKLTLQRTKSVRIRVRVTLQLTISRLIVSQSVRPGIEALWDSMLRFNTRSVPYRKHIVVQLASVVG
jgi:hypothetical protein